MTEVQKFRKKPVVIEAMQVGWLDDQSAIDAVTDWCPAASLSGDQLIIRTLEGDMSVSRWDFIIKGVNGEFYPCKPDIFAKTYEPANEPTA